MKRILITLAIIIVYIAMLVVYSEVHSEDFYLRFEEREEPVS